MPELTCPECSSPIDLPVVPSKRFVCCETCCTEIEMPFALAERPHFSPSEPTPEPLGHLRFPHCAEQVPAWVSKATTKVEPKRRPDSATAIMIAVIAAAVGASILTLGLWRMLA
jgi:hypothetical protein